MKGDTMVLIEGINVNDLPDDDDFATRNDGEGSANFIDLASLEGDVAAFLNDPEETVSTAELKNNKKNNEKNPKPTDPTAMDNVLFGDGNAEIKAKDAENTNPNKTKGSRKKKDADGTGAPAKKKRGGKRTKSTDNTGNSESQVEEAKKANGEIQVEEAGKTNSESQVEEAGAGNSESQVEEAKKAKGNPTVKKTGKGKGKAKVEKEDKKKTEGENPFKNVPPMEPPKETKKPEIIDDKKDDKGNGRKDNPPPVNLPLNDILNKAAQDNNVDYAGVLHFLTEVDPAVTKTLSTKYDSRAYMNDCVNFVKFMSTVLGQECQRPLCAIVSEVVSYIKKNANAAVTASDIINYCNELAAYDSGNNYIMLLDGVGYTKMRVMVENAFIISYLTTMGVSDDLKVANNVDESVDAAVQLAVAVAYRSYAHMLGDTLEKYEIAYKRIETEKPEMLHVVEEGDYDAFYKMLKTFGGYGTVGIDMRDIDLNMESYSPGEAASLYAAVIAKMDEFAARYNRNYDNEDVERVVDSLVSRGYRASQTNAIEYYCDELFNPKKEIESREERDRVSIDHGQNIATRAYIPAGYGLSKSHIEISKPYTEVFGIPFINIRHPLFKTIAMRYSNKYKNAKKSSGKKSAMDKLAEKRVRDIEANADRAERQLIKEIKQGSLMSKFLVGDARKETQVAGEGLGLVSSIEKSLRRITSFASNTLLIKNILKLIKMALDGEETPVSRNTLVVATNQNNAYDRNPIVSNYENDQFANVRVINPVKPEKSAAVSKKYLKQFYDIVNPLENADEYIACGAFSSNLPLGAGGSGMFQAQMNTVSSGTIDPSSVSDAAITVFRQDIMEHDGYPYTYVLTDQFTGTNNEVYRIARNNNFFGDLIRLDVDLVAIHVKKAGMDGVFIMENHDAEVLFS